VPIAHQLINQVSGGICRVQGTTRWSERQSIFTHPEDVIHLPAAEATSFFNGSDDLTHWNYWKREALAYQSGMLDPIDSEACRLCAELAG
jgi:hypothetical protein